MKKEDLQKAIDINKEIDALLDYNSRLKVFMDIIKYRELPFANGLTGRLVTIAGLDIIIPSDILLNHIELHISANEKRIKFLESEFESL